MALAQLTPRQGNFCSKPWTSFEVEHDGTVTPCCMAKTACGNVTVQSIAEIWNGQAYQDFRHNMATGQWQKICRPECPRLRGTINDSVSAPEGAQFAENYALNQAEITRRALVLESWPRIWKTTGSTLCNLDCVMCYQDRSDLRSLPERFYGEMEPLFPYMQEVQIIGGEPFAIKQLRQFMTRFPGAQFPDARFSIVSNATIHDEKTVDIVRALQVSWMSLSVDAATEPTYARIRRKGDFANTLRGVRTWIALGKENGFPVHMAFTVMRDNVGEMLPFAQLAHELGADVLFGKIFGTKGDQHTIDPQALESSIALTHAFIEPQKDRMPLANLTLSSIG